MTRRAADTGRLHPLDEIARRGTRAFNSDTGMGRRRSVRTSIPCLVQDPTNLGRGVISNVARVPEPYRSKPLRPATIVRARLSRTGPQQARPIRAR